MQKGERRQGNGRRRPPHGRTRRQAKQRRKRGAQAAPTAFVRGGGGVKRIMPMLLIEGNLQTETNNITSRGKICKATFPGKMFPWLFHPP